MSDYVIEALKEATFPVHSEAALQHAMFQVLQPLGFAREVDIGVGRLDFYDEVNKIAIEVKTKGAKMALLRQLGRYAEHEDVDTILVVVTKPTLISGIPPSLYGKPVIAIALYQSIL